MPGPAPSPMMLPRGYEKKFIDDDHAAYAAQEVGGPEKGRLAFQPYTTRYCQDRWLVPR